MQKNIIKLILALFFAALIIAGYFFYKTKTHDLNRTDVKESKKVEKNIQGTEIIVYFPNTSLQNKIEEGSCWTNAISLPHRNDAWRCAWGNTIEDPCFSLPGDDSVVCVYDPRNENDAVVIKLTKPLPEHFDVSAEHNKDRAWFIEMEDGSICSPINGTSDVDENGNRADYACSAGGDIYGDLQEGLFWKTSDGRIIKKIWQ
jgi:hypothetical protein